MTKAYTQMSVADALYTAARRYPGSVEALAGRLGKSPNVLRSKLGPDVDTHHVTLEEALQIIELLDVTVPSAADLVVKAMAYRLARVVVRHSGIDSAETTLEVQTLALAARVGALSADVAVAMDATGGNQALTKKQADSIKATISASLDALFLLADSVEQRTKHK